MPRRVPRAIPHSARALGGLALTVAACLVTAPGALADSASSVNWAGYAGHRAGIHFRTVSARWRVPEGACGGGEPAFSSIWVGIGGYSQTSRALEQTGTEFDCTRSGRPVYSAWYELVPAAAHDVSLGVRSGDLMSGAVTVIGHRVTVALQDVTDHRAFRQTLYASQVDTSSADWIVEAPSACRQSGDCFTLPLANFGTATMFSAHAVTQSGHSGAVASHWWATTTITLRPQGTRFFTSPAAGPAPEASPSALSAPGSAFSVVYQPPSATSPGQTGLPNSGLRAGGRQLVHLPR